MTTAVVTRCGRSASTIARSIVVTVSRRFPARLGSRHLDILIYQLLDLSRTNDNDRGRDHRGTSPRPAAANRSRRPRHRAPPLSIGGTASADLAAWPHRPPLVCRGWGFQRSGDALRPARPLHLPHAVLAGRGAGEPRNPPPGWRACGDRQARDLAPFCPALRAVSRHADAPLVRTVLAGPLRRRGAAEPPKRCTHLRPNRR